MKKITSHLLLTATAVTSLAITACDSKKPNEAADNSSSADRSIQAESQSQSVAEQEARIRELELNEREIKNRITIQKLEA